MTEERSSVIFYIRSQSCPKMGIVLCQRLRSHLLFTAVEKMSVELVTTINGLPR